MVKHVDSIFGSLLPIRLSTFKLVNSELHLHGHILQIGIIPTIAFIHILSFLKESAFYNKYWIIPALHLNVIFGLNY